MQAPVEFVLYIPAAHGEHDDAPETESVFVNDPAAHAIQSEA